MAHLGGLRALATGIYMSIIPAQQAPTSHPTCTHTLHSFRPFTPELERFGSPTPVLPRNPQFGIRPTSVDLKSREPAKNLARFQWHEVVKVAHHYLSVDALREPMQVRELATPYGDMT
jgi:hypothetical protein